MDDKVGQNPDISEPGHAKSDTFLDSLTKTDKSFYDRAIRDFKEPYYKFGETERTEKCLQCDSEFKTTLSMLRFCSYEHYSDALAGKQ